MLKSAQDGPYNDVAEPLDGTNQRRILGQSKMRPNIIIVAGIGFQDSAQMLFPEDHDVIQALPTDRADQPLRMAILPG